MSSRSDKLQKVIDNFQTLARRSRDQQTVKKKKNQAKDHTKQAEASIDNKELILHDHLVPPRKKLWMLPTCFCPPRKYPKVH